MGGASVDFYLDTQRLARTQAMTYQAKALANVDARRKILAAVETWGHKAFSAAGC